MIALYGIEPIQSLLITLAADEIFTNGRLITKYFLSLCFDNLNFFMAIERPTIFS